MFYKQNKIEIGQGGDAGEIFIAAGKIIGDGKITANGGNGSIGGRGGRITLISGVNKFSGIVSAKGGKSSLKKRKWFETWWGILILGIAGSGIIAIIFYFL